MIFGLYTDGIIIDRFANETYYFSIDGFRLNEVERVLKNKIVEEKENPTILGIKKNTSDERFRKNVETAKEYLKAGEIFQVVLSRRTDIKSTLDPLSFYKILRKINPAPYMFLLDFEKVKLIGSSPESLVKVTGKTIETNPIAGTRPRGRTLEEDKKLEQELLADEKENAEHVM